MVFGVWWERTILSHKQAYAAYQSQKQKEEANMHTQSIRVLSAVAVLISLAGSCGAQPADFDARTGGLLVGDKSLDLIALTRDLNGDGDVNDADEVVTYFDNTNAEGFADPTPSVYSICQAADGWVYAVDGTSDTAWRLRDLNGDGDAEDLGEAGVWFDNTNASGLTLVTSNGVWPGDDGAVYIINAGTSSSPFDAVYRTVDLNGDGDANDAGEATLWMDIQNLYEDSSAFEIVFMGDTAYYTDLVGGNPDALLWAEDLDGNGVIDVDEYGVVFDDNNAYGVKTSFPLATDGTSLYVMDDDDNGVKTLYRFTDLNGSKTLDSPDEFQVIWTEDLVPEGYLLGSVFSITYGPDHKMAVESSGSDSKDNVFVLIDANGDGDYLDDGETTVWADANSSGEFLSSARAVEYALPYCAADLNADGVIGQEDLGILLASYGMDDGGDVDGDGDTDQADLGALLALYGNPCW